ncbi:GNAT family N-acetyltransferase [Pseudoxanthomonas koreensis]|nr:GNAT family N-acetyltransferase [Pseudoxanthomonas koreensis]
MRAAGDEAALRAAWPVVVQLRPHLDEHAFVAQALRQLAEGWQATVLYDARGIPRAFAGWRVQEMLAHGRFLYVDDLVTDATTRSSGHGKALLDWLKDQARALGCASLQLDSGTQRTDAHAFYLRERLRITSFHFGIPLDR